MRQAPIYTAWTIRSRSPEESQVLRQWLSSRIDRDRVVTDSIHTLSGGVEHVEAEDHRLGDYFAAILMQPTSDPAVFRLVFHRLPQAGRFWKDLMVNILQEITATSANTSITLDYKGDEIPCAAATGGPDQIM
jgi:hypothetical protein